MSTLITLLFNSAIASALVPVSPAFLVKVTVGSVVYPLPPEFILIDLITPPITTAVASAPVPSPVNTTVGAVE